MDSVFIVAKAVSTGAMVYIKAHPYKATFVAANVGLAPVLGSGWLIAMPLNFLGFGPGGVVGGSAAAWYQSTVYGGFVPADSVFAALQHLGAVL